MFNLENPQGSHQVNTLKPHAWFLPYTDPKAPIPLKPEETNRALKFEW